MTQLETAINIEVKRIEAQMDLAYQERFGTPVTQETVILEPATEAMDPLDALAFEIQGPQPLPQNYDKKRSKDPNRIEKRTAKEQTRDYKRRKAAAAEISQVMDFRQVVSI